MNAAELHARTGRRRRSALELIADVQAASAALSKAVAFWGALPPRQASINDAAAQVGGLSRTLAELRTAIHDEFEQ